MNTVIIGNSAGAVGCVEALRAAGGQGKITLVSDEPYHTYSRPLISYLLSGKTDREKMKYRPDDFYEKNRVRFLPGTRAVSVDPEKKTVALDSGEILPYDKLLCAAGSRPFVPPIPGLELVEKKTTFMTIADVERLEEMITPESRVLVMGAGLIGLKCAQGLLDRVRSVTVCDLAGQILPSILDPEGAAMVQKHIEKHGIRFLLGAGASSFTAREATLSSGETVPFDVLVIAVGVRPNTELLQKAGAEVDRGILVDEYARTSLPEVYAAGDCTQSYDIAGETSRVLAILPGAYLQGEAAGYHMAGTPKPFDRAIAMNAIDFFGLHIITAGVYQGEARTHQGDGCYKKLFTGEDRLKGYILIGQVERAGIYTSLIRNRTPLSSIDFDLIFEKPQLMAFSKRERAHQLAGR